MITFGQCYNALNNNNNFEYVSVNGLAMITEYVLLILTHAIFSRFAAAVLLTLDTCGFEAEFNVSVSYSIFYRYTW